MTHIIPAIKRERPWHGIVGEYQVAIYDPITETIIDVGAVIYPTREQALADGPALIALVNGENHDAENWDAPVWDTSDLVVLRDGHIED